MEFLQNVDVYLCFIVKCNLLHSVSIGVGEWLLEWHKGHCFSMIVHVMRLYCL